MTRFVILSRSVAVGAARPSVFLVTLFLDVLIFWVLDLVAAEDLTLLSGLVLTILRELDEELLAGENDFDLEEELLEEVTDCDLDVELLEADLTAGLDCFTDGVLLIDREEEELFRELLLRTEVDFELLLLDPDFRCA